MGYINIWASKMYVLPDNHQLGQRLINDNIGLVHMDHIQIMAHVWLAKTSRPMMNFSIKQLVYCLISPLSGVYVHKDKAQMHNRYGIRIAYIILRPGAQPGRSPLPTPLTQRAPTPNATA